MTPQLLGGARQGAGRVRPPGARARARAALGTDPRGRSRCSCARSARGEDFFRSAVIEALGDYKAQYAVRRDARPSPSSTVRCRTMRRWRSGRSATSARSRRWPRLQRTRAAEPAAVDRRRRSACSASTASRTRAISIETLKFADTNPGFQELLRGAASGLGALGVAGRADRGRRAVRRSASRRAIRRARRSRWRWRRSRCATRR